MNDDLAAPRLHSGYADQFGLKTRPAVVVTLYS
jgi:hypothetical protein